MSAGKVVFHSAIQPTKKMLLEQYETLENAAYGKLKWRTSDWVRVLGSLCVRVCSCVCVLLTWRFSQTHGTGLLDPSENRTREKEHTLRLLTPQPWLSRFSGQRRMCLRSGQTFYLLWGKSKENRGKLLCVSLRGPELQQQMQTESAEAANDHSFYTN